MRVALVYIHVVNPEANSTELYLACSKRFAATYYLFPPGLEHDLFVVSCQGQGKLPPLDIFAPLPVNYEVYDGGGWDIGAYQMMARKLDHDFVVFATSRVHLHKPGWLHRIVNCREQFGEGLYGNSGSYEHCSLWRTDIRNEPVRNPHIRTEFFGCNPAIMRTYPMAINSRHTSFQFESDRNSLTNFYISKGLETRVATWDGCYRIPDWRTPPNIFRRGDQSNLLVWDRHTDIYHGAEPHVKAELAAVTGDFA